MFKKSFINQLIKNMMSINILFSGTCLAKFETCSCFSTQSHHWYFFFLLPHTSKQITQKKLTKWPFFCRLISPIIHFCYIFKFKYTWKMFSQSIVYFIHSFRERHLPILHNILRYIYTFAKPCRHEIYYTRSYTTGITSRKYISLLLFIMIFSLWLTGVWCGNFFFFVLNTHIYEGKKSYKLRYRQTNILVSLLISNY